MVMLATLGGTFALVLGLAILLLPLLAAELSRPRDSAWGALILVLGLVLVTSAERLTGEPMLAVLLASLLVGRLGTEVGQARWRQLDDEEKQCLWSAERWRTSLEQLIAAFLHLVEVGLKSSQGLGNWIAAQRQAKTKTKTKGKLWVRPEQEAAPAEEVTEPAEEVTEKVTSAAEPAAPRTELAADGEAVIEDAEFEDAPKPDTSEPDTSEPDALPEAVVVVKDFGEIDAMIDAALETEAASPTPPDRPEAG